MPRFAIRFDLRNPAFAGVSMHERYRAALDMAEWADRLDFVSVTVSEHHGVDDGYLPSAATMAAALAARTTKIRIVISAIVAATHDPLGLAEQLSVADNISGGRLDVVITNGYVDFEFAMFGHAPSERAKCVVEMVETLRAAWTGRPFEFRGRPARVTPAPHRAGGPAIILGGKTEPAARRAARIADGFAPSSAEAWRAYRGEVVKLGRSDPGAGPGADISFFHLSHDPDADWPKIAPHALHETNSYGRWLAAAGLVSSDSYAPVADAETLRKTGQYRVLSPDQFVAEIKRKGADDLIMVHPLMGGIPPALAWQSLRLLEREVLPQL